jgi:hypothetical protein
VRPSVWYGIKAATSSLVAVIATQPCDEAMLLAVAVGCAQWCGVFGANAKSRDAK